MKRILLVEDDPLIVEIYTTQLEKAGFQVDSAIDGEIAFEKAKNERFDLLVLDIVLPFVTGFEVLRKIRNQEELKNLKVLILSNLSQKSDMEMAKNLGAIKYLVKAHYTPSEVVEEIKKALK